MLSLLCSYRLNPRLGRSISEREYSFFSRIFAEEILGYSGTEFLGFKRARSHGNVYGMKISELTSIKKLEKSHLTIELWPFIALRFRASELLKPLDDLFTIVTSFRSLSVVFSFCLHKLRVRFRLTIALRLVCTEDFPVIWVRRFGRL